MRIRMMATRQGPGRFAEALAVLAFAGFWALPFSPVLAIGAVSATRDAAGWPRNLAVAGAILCIGYTLALSLLLVVLAWRSGLLT